MMDEEEKTDAQKLLDQLNETKPEISGIVHLGKMDVPESKVKVPPDNNSRYTTKWRPNKRELKRKRKLGRR